MMKQYLIALLMLIVIVSLGLTGWSYITLRVKSHFQTGAMVGGKDVFTTSALRDTVLVPGVKSTDVYLATSQTDTNTVVIIAKNDTLIAIRKGGGASAAAYCYLRIEPQ